MSYFRPFLRRATRRRTLVKDESESTSCDDGHGRQGDGLKRCLTTFDLISLGVGSCCGAGMYLTVGKVSHTAGFGATLSFVVAGLGSMLSGLCFAELAAACPRTSGSAYMYIYVTVGELVAFVIGWGLIVEYAIGTAAAAVALSSAVDTMSNFSYGKIMTGITGAFVGRPYFDVIALAVCLILTLVLWTGVEMSASFNHLMNFVNFIVLIGFFVCSIILARKDVTVENGPFPRGIPAAITTIPTAYYAFVGFDMVATTGEEAKDPSKSIPRSIWISVLINTIVYVTIAICLNIVVPFHDIDSNSAMIHMFLTVGWPNAIYLVSIGAVCALFAATFGSLFPLPRVLYAMAKDGLMCRKLEYICPSRKTPKIAIIVSGILTAIVSVTVDLDILIELVLLGTLLSYILVSVCVLLLRYSFDDDSPPLPCDRRHVDERSPICGEISKEKRTSDSGLWKRLWAMCKKAPSDKESLTGEELCGLLGVMLVAEALCSFIIVMSQNAFVTENGRTLLYACVIPFLIMLCLVLLILTRLPQNDAMPGFRVPLVPLLPVLVTFFNMYLMLSISWVSWCMFGVWMLLGLCVYIYFSHGNDHIATDTTPLLVADAPCDFE